MANKKFLGHVNGVVNNTIVFGILVSKEFVRNLLDMILPKIKLHPSLIAPTIMIGSAIFLLTAKWHYGSYSTHSLYASILLWLTAVITGFSILVRKCQKKS